MKQQILNRIAEVLEARRTATPERSYTASLYAAGEPAIAEKILEEAAELATAGEGADEHAIVHEVADLWFHCQVLLAYKQIDVDDVLDELARRFGTSGLDEKRNRPSQS